MYFEHTDGTTGGCGTLTDILDFRQEKNGTVKVMNRNAAARSEEEEEEQVDTSYI